MRINDIHPDILARVRQGTVIPAMPLALDENRNFSTKNQRAIARYYIDAGVGGIAVGVHSTQFEIRDPDIQLFKPVLSETAKFIDEYCRQKGKKILKVAGVCGLTPQAMEEARFAVEQGYDACLLSLSALKDSSIADMLSHTRAISTVMPVIGFYLQPSVGGRKLPYEFWRQFAEIDNILAIKMAPFNRYQTFDVVRAVAEAGKENDITLYTGNDDNIVNDLLTEYKIETKQGTKSIRIKGGLLGHWCVWTQKAVQLLDEIQQVINSRDTIPAELLTRNIQITDANAAFFDPSHDFAGCIPGIHEVLRRQGLLKGTWCLNPDEVLSPGQSEEIDRVYHAYPHLNDDDFVRKHLDEWFS